MNDSNNFLPNRLMILLEH